ELGYVEQGMERLVQHSQRCFHSLDDVLPCRRPQPAAQLRNEQAQGVQGLAQVVVCGGQEARLRQVGELELLGAVDGLSLQVRIGLLELGGHEVELIPQGLQIIAGLDRNAPAELAAADPFSPPTQSLPCPD